MAKIEKEIEMQTNRNASKEAIVSLREKTGMSRKEFCEYFGIPYRSMQDWELGNRAMPEYVLRLMEYKVQMDLLSKKKEEKDE